MNNKLYIPETISVGYQERKDTYTGKLAYVIYTDAKGVLRKANSWNSWRNDNIEPDLFKNEPMSGFILNRDVGGTRRSYGWNARVEKVRVYDPRGFEMEVSIPNLLFILQECTSSKGKGLEGEFVYSWQGPELVLLPTSSSEYKECLKFTSVQAKKVSARELIPGATYLTKDMGYLVYLGRFQYYTLKSDYNYRNYSFGRSEAVTNYEVVHKKQHIFYEPQKDTPSYSPKFLPLPSMNKLARVANESCVDNYAELVDEFQNSTNGSKPVSMEVKKIKVNDIEQIRGYNSNFFYKKDGEFYSVSVSNQSHLGELLGYNLRVNYFYNFDGSKIIEKYHSHKLTLPNVERKFIGAKTNNLWGNRRIEYYEKDDILNCNWYEVKIITENGAKFNIKKYLKK